MAKNYVQDGNVLVLTSSGAVSSGDVVISGVFIGVALSDIGAADAGPVALEGVWSLPKAAEDLAEGELVYWDAGAGNVTATATANTLIGTATEAALTAVATVPVRLVG